MTRINASLDTMVELLQNSKPLPFSNNKCLVDVDELLDFIENIKKDLPTEIAEAQKIVMDRKQIIDEANAKASAIISEANREATATVKTAKATALYILNKHEITTAAQQKATETIAQANKNARDIKEAAYKYSQSMLDDVEKSFNDSLNAIKKTKNCLKKIK